MFKPDRISSANLISTKYLWQREVFAKTCALLYSILAEGLREYNAIIVKHLERHDVFLSRPL